MDEHWRHQRLNPASLRPVSCALAAVWLLCHPSLLACNPGAECAARSAPLDSFQETLSLQLVPSKAGSPPLFLARFEFGIEAAAAAPHAAGASSDHYDLLPKPLGKLLSTHGAMAALEAALTRGRWKEEWGSPPREFRPPGAVLVAAVNSTREAAVSSSWRFLSSTLSGALCASFEGMDPGRESSIRARPLGVPWAEPGHRLLLATLPYEPVCTENLTPWLKLLPCGRHLGLAALIAPLAIAESPLVSLTLAVARKGGAPARASLRASLDVVLPLAGAADSPGLGRWLGGAFEPCPAARSSTVLLHSPEPPPRLSHLLQAGAEVLELPEGAGHALRLPTARFAALGRGGAGTGPGAAAGEVTPAAAEEGTQSWPRPPRELEVARLHTGGGSGVSVMRDVLSREGRSERTHGRYLLRFTNTGPKRHVHFMDQMPFFLRPLWHTLRATTSLPGAQAEELSGLAAMRRLRLRFVPSDGKLLPTEIFLSVDVPRGGVISVFLDVDKAFIQLGAFSYACEKGFDVGSAAWLEAEADAGAGPVRAGELLRPPDAQGPPRGGWGLQLSGGLIVLLPMPDFSMPFNVIALSSTAVTFFFGSVFRLTAAGRMPHFVLRTEDAADTRGRRGRKRLLLPLAALALAALCSLRAADASGLAELRRVLPGAAAPVVDALEAARASIERLGR